MGRGKSQRVDFVEAIEKLEERLPTIREGKRRLQVRYPVDFKAAVREIIQAGMDVKLISRRLGISVLTLKTWTEAPTRDSKATHEKVRELVLVPDVFATQELVRVRIGERVCLEVTVGALRGDLLRELAMLGGA